MKDIRTDVEKTQIIVAHHQRFEIQATGVPVKTDINPIARYNHAISLYYADCNKIEGIELISICCPCPISWIYDVVIYFYTLFFLTITCQSAT